MNVEDVKKLTVEKLKNELKSRDLDTTGKKAELAERLEAHLQSQPEPSAQTNGVSSSTSAAAPAGSSAPAAGKARHSIVWTAALAEGPAAVPEAAAAAEQPAAEEPASGDATETTDTPAEASEEEKRKARAKKFGLSESAASPPKESGKRKAEDPEAVALVSDDIIAKRQARFKTQEETAEEQRKQRFMDPDAVKAKERKERFGQWLPQESSGKISKDAVAAAIGTSLDNSMPAKGRAKAGSAAAAPKEEKYSAEFTAKAEARKARFAGKK
ncbi:hypothetical protein ABBQ32_009445 [Trebouxia sp. C0010 RCD-2024]